jgi:hypothetical protein
MGRGEATLTASAAGRQCRIVRRTCILAVLFYTLFVSAQLVPIKVKIEANRSKSGTATSGAELTWHEV